MLVSQLLLAFASASVSRIPNLTTTDCAPKVTPTCEHKKKVYIDPSHCTEYLRIMQETLTRASEFVTFSITLQGQGNIPKAIVVGSYSLVLHASHPELVEYENH